MLLDPYIAPGCIVLFDDLVNYPDYREHEIRALWEWLEASKRQVEVRLFLWFICCICCHAGSSLVIKLAFPLAVGKSAVSAVYSNTALSETRTLHCMLTPSILFPRSAQCTLHSAQQAVDAAGLVCGEIHSCQTYDQAGMLQVVGVLGPLPMVDNINKTHAMEINPPFDLGWHHQSVAFIVL